MKSDVVSIVIPVYNVEKFLDHCVQSLTQQTYSNLEIILVDDGSTDASAEICDRWAAQDSRIRVVHKEYGGVADARNAGVDACTGQYIVFVDADDHVHPEYVSYLYDLKLQNQADIAVCEFRYETTAGKAINSFLDDGSVCVLNQHDALKAMCDGVLLSNSVWAKIYPRAYFDGIRFPVGHIFEDVAVTYQLFLKAQTVVIGRRALYHYIRHNNSIMTSAFNFNRLDSITFAEQMSEAILKHWPDLLPVTQKRLYDSYVCCWRSAVLSRQKSREMDLMLDDLYAKVKAVRGTVRKEKLTPKMRSYLISSYFGKKGMELCFLIENSLYQHIKLR